MIDLVCNMVNIYISFNKFEMRMILFIVSIFVFVGTIITIMFNSYEKNEPTCNEDLKTEATDRVETDWLLPFCHITK